MSCNTMKRKIVEHYGLESHISGEDGEPTNEDFRVAFCNLNLTLRDGKPVRIPTVEYLYVGSIGCAYNKQKLLDHGITHIVCLSDVIRLNFMDSFEYLRVPMVDRADYDILKDISKVFEFIQTAKAIGGRVLIHCYQGKSRSCAVCCAYLIKYYEHTVMSSLDLIREVRPCASPNTGFMAALQKFEVECRVAEETENGGNMEI